MNKTITNEVLAERMKQYHISNQKNFDNFQEELKNVEKEMCLNSDFRKQAKTTLGFVTAIATIVGGVIVFIADKMWEIIGK